MLAAAPGLSHSTLVSLYARLTPRSSRSGLVSLQASQSTLVSLQARLTARSTHCTLVSLRARSSQPRLSLVSLQARLTPRYAHTPRASHSTLVRAIRYHEHHRLHYIRFTTYWLRPTTNSIHNSCTRSEYNHSAQGIGTTESTIRACARRTLSFRSRHGHNQTQFDTCKT